MVNHLSKESEKAFEKETKILILERLKIALIIGIIFFPAYSLLDFTLYNEKFNLLFLLRIFGTLFLIFFYYLARKDFAKNWADLLGICAFLLIGIFMESVIFITGGYNSFNYIGMGQIILAILILQFKLIDTIYLCISLTLFYNIPNYFLGNTYPAIIHTNAAFFLIIILVILINFYNNKLRFKEFTTRQLLLNANANLKKNSTGTQRHPISAHAVGEDEVVRAVAGWFGA